MEARDWVEIQKETILRDVRVDGIEHALYLAMDAINFRISRGDKELREMSLSEVRRCIMWMIESNPKMTRQKQWADAQAKAGKCRQCGRQAVTASHCAKCAEKHRARSAAWMRKHRAKNKSK